MGQAKLKKAYPERLAAARAAREAQAKEAESKLKLFQAEVGLARLRYGLDLGILEGVTHRIVAVKLDELVALLERLMPETADTAPEDDEEGQMADRAAEAVLDEEV